MLVAASTDVVIPPPSPSMFKSSFLRSIPSVPVSPLTVNVWLNPDNVVAIEALRAESAAW